MRATIQKHFVDKADNTFLWVALMYDELARDSARPWHALKALETIPPGLNALYKRMMRDIAASEDAELCKQILTVVCVVYRPVSLKELAAIVNLPTYFNDNPAALNVLIGSCGSFLTIREGIVYLVHQSAKDYLLSKTSSQILPYGVAHEHRSILSISLEVLSQALHRDIFGLANPGLLIDEISPPDPDPLDPIRYACMHWVDHLEAADMLAHEYLQDGGCIHVFLQKMYLYWLEATSLHRSISHAVQAVQKLQTLVQKSGTKHLAALVEDARRFILSHEVAIEIAPLQLYASALVFSPIRSIVRTLFEHDLPSWFMSPSLIQMEWDACVQTLEGHGGTINSVTFMTGGKLASGSYDETVRIWDTATGQCVRTLRGHDGVVWSSSFTAAGSQLASGSDDKTIKIWEEATGKYVRTLEGHSGGVRSVAFTADGTRLTSGSDDKTVRIWDTATGQCVQTLKGHSDWVRSVVFTADGSRLASGSDDKTVKIWDAATGQCISSIEGHGSVVRSVAFATDGSLLASGSDDKTVKIWDTGTGQCVQKLEGHVSCVISVGFTVDCTRLASGSYNKTIKIWNVATGQCVQTLKGHSDWVRSVVFTADGSRLASGSDDKTVKIWDATTGHCLSTLKGHGSVIRLVAVAMDGSLLASGSDDETIKIWDTDTCQCLQTLKGHSGRVTSVVFTASGTHIASGAGDQTVKIWDTVTGACVQTLKVDRVVHHLSFTSTRNYHLLSGIGTLKLGPLTSGAMLYEATSSQTSYHGCGISLDGAWIVMSTHRLLWLPSEYRPLATSIKGSRIGLGCSSGRVLIAKLDLEELEL